MIPEAAGKRWASPAWAIAASRRLRARASLAELQAIAIADGDVAAAAARHPELGQVTYDRGAIHSSRYGTLAFTTPMGEILPTAVTGEEAAAFRRWSDSWRRRGGWMLPMAARLGSLDGGVQIDLVLPGNTRARPHSGPTADCGLLFGLPLDRLPVVWRDRLLPWKQGPGDPFTLGDGSVLWWCEGTWDATTDPATWPLVCRVGSSDLHRAEQQLKALQTLATSKGLSAVLDSTGKRLTTGPLGGGLLGGTPLIAAVAAEGLLFTSQANAKLLDRTVPRLPVTLAPMAPAMLRLDGSAARMLNVIEPALDPHLLAWSLLPLLSEWKRSNPTEDPAAFHARAWSERPVDPSGQPFILDPDLGQMVSGAYGSPWVPRAGPAAPTPWLGLARLDIAIRWLDGPALAPPAAAALPAVLEKVAGGASATPASLPSGTVSPASATLPGN